MRSECVARLLDPRGEMLDPHGEEVHKRRLEP
jgi:hypothetical protein